MFPQWTTLSCSQSRGIPIVNEKDPIKDKDEKDYTNADYKTLEKNYRAMKVLYSALTPGDEQKVMKYTAQEIRESLVWMYGGNEDTKRNKIPVAAKVYEKVEQGKNESLEDFHTRFTCFVRQMELLEESLP